MYLSVGEANHVEAAGFETGGTSEVVLGLIWLSVRVAVDLDAQSCGGATEIGDEAA
jgi:hypothetical protein